MNELPDDDLTDEEWKHIKERVEQRDTAGDEEVKSLFDKYRSLSS